MSQVCNDGEGGRRTIDGAAELGSSNIVNQHVFETQLAIFSRYIEGAFHRERLDRMNDWHRSKLLDQTPNLNASMPSFANLGSAGS